MKTRHVLATALVTCVGVGVIAVAPAQAYDRDAYAYAAGHMIERSDIPASLGDFRKALAFNAYTAGDSLVVCDVPQSDPNVQDLVVKVPAGRYSFSANYSAKGKDAPSIDVTVNQYASAEKAISAFQSLAKGVKKCVGSGSNTWTDPDTGAVTTYSTQITNGVVPEVTTTGVESVFVSNNSLSETTPGDTKYVNDQYAVFSLFDDTIIQTQYFTNTNTNMTSKQRKAVNQVAFNAETRWLG